jgi:hypothetical protein
MTSSTPTKAAIAEALEAANAKLAELREQLEAAERVQLRQVLWLNGDEPRRQGHTAGDDLWVACSAQYATRRQGATRRDYGAYKDLIAYGEQAQALIDAYADGNHLVAITAYERPARPQEGEKRRFSDWVVTSVAPLERPQAPAEPAQAEQAEPTDEEVPF